MDLQDKMVTAKIAFYESVSVLLQQVNEETPMHVMNACADEYLQALLDLEQSLETADINDP